MLFQAILRLDFEKNFDYKRVPNQKGRASAEAVLKNIKQWLAWQIRRQN